MDFNPCAPRRSIMRVPKIIRPNNLQFYEPKVLLLLVNLGFGKHGLYHLVNVLIRLIVASRIRLHEIETDITCSLVS